MMHDHQDHEAKPEELSAEELESEIATELPDREMLSIVYPATVPLLPRGGVGVPGLDQSITEGEPVEDQPPDTST